MGWANIHLKNIDENLKKKLIFKTIFNTENITEKELEIIISKVDVNKTKVNQIIQSFLNGAEDYDDLLRLIRNNDIVSFIDLEGSKWIQEKGEWVCYRKGYKDKIRYIKI